MKNKNRKTYASKVWKAAQFYMKSDIPQLKAAEQRLKKRQTKAPAGAAAATQGEDQKENDNIQAVLDILKQDAYEAMTGGSVGSVESENFIKYHRSTYQTKIEACGKKITVTGQRTKVETCIQNMSKMMQQEEVRLDETTVLCTGVALVPMMPIDLGTIETQLTQTYDLSKAACKHLVIGACDSIGKAVTNLRKDLWDVKISWEEICEVYAEKPIETAENARLWRAIGDLKMETFNVQHGSVKAMTEMATRLNAYGLQMNAVGAMTECA